MNFHVALNNIINSMITRQEIEAGDFTRVLPLALSLAKQQEQRWLDEEAIQQLKLAYKREMKYLENHQRRLKAIARANAALNKLENHITSVSDLLSIFALVTAISKEEDKRLFEIKISEEAANSWKKPDKVKYVENRKSSTKNRKNDKKNDIFKITIKRE
ncbi:hypothetical protein F2K73_004401 [Vibrio fluvialis]|nr:hypothetical protein [Vibrio fluvialis]